MSKKKVSKTNKTTLSIKSKKYLKFRFALFFIIVVGLAISVVFYQNQIDNYLNANKLEVYQFEDGHEIKESDLRINYVNVDQGDSTIIQFPDGKNLIIDGGSARHKDKLLSYIESQNIKTFDWMILTHSDEDHAGGLIDVLKNYEVKNIWRPYQKSVYKDYQDPLIFDGQFSQVTTLTYKNFLELSYKETYLENGLVKNANIYVNSEDAEIIYSGFKLDFLTPLEIDSTPLEYDTVYYRDVNDYSPIMFISYLGKKIVFSGDAEKHAEADFIEAFKNNPEFKNIDVFKLGHHGSKTSSSDAIINYFNPKMFIVSCGINNKYNHPSPETMDRIKAFLNQTTEENIFRTDLNGTITVGINENGIYVTALNNNVIEKSFYQWSNIAIGLGILSFTIIFFPEEIMDKIRKGEKISLSKLQEKGKSTSKQTSKTK